MLLLVCPPCSDSTAMTRGATQQLIGPSCEIIASKLKYFN